MMDALTKNNYWVFVQVLLGVFTLQMHGFTQTSTLVVKGYVSYTSSRNIYVKFESTKALQVGDTLFRLENTVSIPALLINNKSSTSCVCTPLDTHLYVRNEPIVSGKKIDISQEPSQFLHTAHIDSVHEFPIVQKENSNLHKSSSLKSSKVWKGRFSLASYSAMGSKYADPTHRFQYTFNTQGSSIAGIPLAVETYVSFRHKDGEWYKVEQDLNQALKIYSLAATYEFNPNFRLTAGRKINYKLASMGAIDGVQCSYKLGSIELGGIYGARPDYKDYGVNFNFREYGIYINHQLNRNHSFDLQQTMAWVEQFNHGKTDRRFLYLQHTGNLWNKLNLFGSAEIDLFQNIHDTVAGIFKLSNIYISSRYRFNRKFSFTVSYDARSNVIYYETYRNEIDRLLDEETRKGLRVQLQCQAMKRMSLSISSNWRFQNSGINSSSNYNLYVSYSNLPFLKGPVSLSFNYLKTDYLISQVSGFQASKDFWNGLFYYDAYLRYIRYQYRAYEFQTQQWLIGGSINIRFSKMYTLGLYAEETLDEQDAYLRVNARVMMRF